MIIIIIKWDEITYPFLNFNDAAVFSLKPLSIGTIDRQLRSMHHGQHGVLMVSAVGLSVSLTPSMLMQHRPQYSWEHDASLMHHTWFEPISPCSWLRGPVTHFTWLFTVNQFLKLAAGPHAFHFHTRPVVCLVTGFCLLQYQIVPIQDLWCILSQFLGLLQDHILPIQGLWCIL